MEIKELMRNKSDVDVIKTAFNFICELLDDLEKTESYNYYTNDFVAYTDDFLKYLEERYGI